MAQSVAQFLKHLSDSGILPEEELSKVQAKAPADRRDADANAFAAQLVRESTLTLFQANKLYSGKPVGLVLGNYVVLDKIGAGGMGMVFRARHKRMNRIVAIKVLPREAMGSTAGIARFRREVEAAAKLSHPNIVAAHDADECKGLHYLVMEYVDGSDLEQRIGAQGPLTAEEATNVITQAARGLAHAHAQGVIHRDIKPSNLLVDSQGTVKILDMGLAYMEAEQLLQQPDSAMTRLTQAGIIIGTIDFMSPEQAVDARNVSIPSDIYSLGCTFYFLLTGQPVFSGNTPMERLVAHREAPIPSLIDARCELPPQLDIILSKMIAKKPESRYQSVEALLGDLEQWQSLQQDRSVVAAHDDDNLPPDVLSQIFED